MVHDIVLYRNGLELTEGTDWQVWKESLTRRTQVVIDGLVGSIGNLNDIYTVEYKPNFTYYQQKITNTDHSLSYDDDGDETTFYLNEKQDTWYRQNNMVEFTPVYTSEITLIVMLRNLTIDRTQTPILKQYKLMLSGVSLV
jgi:hypothetical protein